jgi:hypothetical protein
MKIQNVFLMLLVISTMVLSGFGSVDTGSDLEGTWSRVSDQLRIHVSAVNDADKQESFIVADGNQKFPCEVAHLPIYKNIVKVGRSLWRCDFLVVTMGSCKTEYEEGIIQLTNEGKMIITCPGFEKKTYTRVRPRYEN